MRVRSGAEVRLSTSRTDTARVPLPRPVPISFFATPIDSFLAAYAGAPAIPPSHPAFPGHTAEIPFADVAIQLQCTFSDPDVLVLFTLDLGQNQDLSRIELYGNPLLAPLTNAEKPDANFGLPPRIHVFVTEEPFAEADLHRRSQRGQFYENPLMDWREVWSSQDFRALWGWNALHLNAAFGRYVTFAFPGLPAAPPRAGSPAYGIDLQRIVIFPYLEDADHRPQVEHSVVSARTSNYLVASDYWTALNQLAPTPATHQGVFFDHGHDALPLPCGLSGIPTVGQGGVAELFVSHPVPADTSQDNRIFLITEATTDHEPLLEGVRLLFRPPEDKKLYQGPKLPFWPDYLIRIHVTSDREAAYSSDPGHRSWRLVRTEENIEAEHRNEALLFFAEPVVARWVRLTVRPSGPSGVDPLPPTVFQLYRLDLLRCHSWQLTAPPDEDIDVETVFIRLRGPKILDDYAYIDGSAGFGITVEARGESGAFETVRAFRNLLEVIEETHNRVFQNQRRIDKPVQRYHEISDSQSRSDGQGTAASTASQTATVLPDFGNRQVTRSGTLTNYVRNPHDNLGSSPLPGVPDIDTTGLVSTRTYEGDLSNVGPPNIDLANISADAIFDAIVAWANNAAAQGFPMSVGIGGNFGAGGGISLGGVGTLSGGVSVNAGTQVGGGVTRSETRGNQGTIVRSETLTIDSKQRQDLESTSNNLTHQETAAHDDRTVVREDLSQEVRKPGVEVRYGGKYEDLVLITIPIGRRLRGGYYPVRYSAPMQAPLSKEVLRVRVDYLPPGVRMDVQFRGRTFPHPEVR